MEMLRVENLCKTYGMKDVKVDALKNVSFSVSKGEFIAIVGPSGSGKVNSFAYFRRSRKTNIWSCLC